MSTELLKVFDVYNDLERRPLFSFFFSEFSSELNIELPLKKSKESIDKVLKLLNLEKQNFSVVTKNWNVESVRNAEIEGDFPNQLLYKSNSKKCLIWIYIGNNDTLTVEFLYDCKDVELEKWILNLSNLLRKTFGLEKKPTFSVLTNDHSYFDTEEVQTEEITINIEDNYNDDFKEVHNEISESITSKKSGLILLYGVPGTGKTTYIKSLISTYNEQNFIFVQNEFIQNLLDPNFISFLLKQRNSVLIIEDAEKVITSRENVNEHSVVSTVLQLTDGLFSDYLNIKIICTFNTNLSKIDQALLRKGRLIAMYDFKPLSVEKTNNLLSEIGVQPSNKELTVADIFNHKERSYSNIKGNKIGF